MIQRDYNDVQKWKRYEFLFEETRDMIFYFSQDGTVEECNRNAYEQLGFEKGDTMNLQQIFRAVIKIEDSTVFFSDECLTDYVDTIIYRKNHTCFPVQIRVALLTSDTGSFGVCRASSLISEQDAMRKLSNAKEEIETAHKERNEMVANVTHELRTPINGILGLAMNMLDTDLTAEQRETVELITHCCHNITQIINDILDFSKLQAGKFTIENRTFDFYSMMNKIVKTHQATIDEKGLKLVCNVSKDIPKEVIGDELRITQCLNNLLSNATKFTERGQIVVNVILSMTFEEELELFFMVIDSGIGISEEEKDKLFKSFSQVDASITRKFGGTGLGLSIVKQLVQMMGGSVNVESEKGKGSTFSFSVRVGKVSEQEAEKGDGTDTGKSEEESFAFHFGVENSEPEDIEVMYQLGSEENLKEIHANLEKLVLCIEMENWERANGIADHLKQLLEEDADLKRKAFRMQMTLRRGDHDTSMKEYESLKEAIGQLEEKNI